MNYEQKIIVFSCLFGFGLNILAIYAVMVKPELFPFSIILSLIGGYIGLSEPSIFTYFRKAKQTKEETQ